MFVSRLASTLTPAKSKQRLTQDWLLTSVRSMSTDLEATTLIPCQTNPNSSQRPQDQATLESTSTSKQPLITGLIKTGRLPNI